MSDVRMPPLVDDSGRRPLLRYVNPSGHEADSDIATPIEILHHTTT